VNRREIFKPASRFRKNLMDHNVQSDLTANTVFPAGWLHFGSRVEIASRYYQRHIFGYVTFAEFEARSRPFVMINADDTLSGNRFEFTQDGFDLGRSGAFGGRSRRRCLVRAPRSPQLDDHTCRVIRQDQSTSRGEMKE
jgi:hypothetical protein